MNQELLSLIEQICREKGVEKAVLVEAILSAVVSAGRKRFGGADNMHAVFAEDTGAIVLSSLKTVLDEDDIVDDSIEVSLEEARELRPDISLGDTVEIIHEMEDFGRIAAQTAKQVIIQKVREAERDIVYRDFKDRQGELVNGIVSRIEREGNFIIDLGKTEGLLPRREQSFRETFKRGDRIRAYIIEVKRASSGPQVILSRTHPGFLTRLFEMEVPEIYEGIVEIKGAVRDSSGRAKIAVTSHDKDIDPIGACVGMKGMRVQAVVQELRGEKIDIIQWTEDSVQFVRNALSPAKVSRVYIHDAEKTMQIIVAPDQLSLAIGKRGQNVRLAAKLTHWKIDIKQEGTDDSDKERLEALRRAESAFHIPKRSAAEPALVPEETVFATDIREEREAEEPMDASAPLAFPQAAEPYQTASETLLEPCDTARVAQIAAVDDESYQTTE